MIWFSSFSVDNWLTVISLLFVITAGIFGYIQWVKANRIKRAEFVHQIFERLRSDEDIASVMYLIDYGSVWYNESFHDGENGFERKVDTLLSFLSYICYLKKKHILTASELRILEYDIRRACESVDVQNYLWNLHHFSRKNGVECSFSYLVQYGIDNKLFRNGFNNPASNAYPKYLNF